MPPAAFSPHCRAQLLRIRSARQSACGLAGQAFFNILLVLRSKCHDLGLGQLFKIFVRHLHQFSMGTGIKRNILILG